MEHAKNHRECSLYLAQPVNHDNVECMAFATTSPNDIFRKKKNEEKKLHGEELVKLWEKIVTNENLAKDTKDSDKGAYRTVLNKYANKNLRCTPHPLAVIDEATYQLFKDNTILLSNMQRFNVKTSNLSDGGQTAFSIESWGENIPLTFKEMNGYSFFADTFEIPLGYMFFMCKASEKCLISDPSIVFVGDKRGTEDYVILFLFVSDVQLFSGTDGIPIWKNLDYLKLLKKEKKSTIKGNKGSHHYGSTGKCYSFGVRNSYVTDSVTKVSLTNYAGDGSTAMKEYKKYIWQYYNAVFMAFDSILKGLSCKLNLSVESMQDISKNTVLDKYVINAEKIECDKVTSILTASINVDCKTRDLHCEKDVTYTTIVVPIQEDATSYIVFQFKLCDWVSFNIRCLQNSCFTYSAYCLTHRQLYTNGTNCMNLSSYSNKRIYCNFRRSYIRVNTKS